MNPLRILLVDHEDDARALLTRWLRDQGHLVCTAVDGGEAIVLLQREEFDLLFTALLMPEVDGMQVIIAARKAQPKLQIVAVTGDGEYLEAEFLLRLSVALGASAKLFRPFSRDQVLKVVETVCGCITLLVAIA